MNILELASQSPKTFKQALQLYRNSFPIYEQRPMEEHVKASEDAAFHPDVIMLDGEFLGIIYYWIYDQHYCFIEHLATIPEKRGGGYGAKVLSILREKGYKIILEIDPPEEEISIRRRMFYERQGFHMNDYLHIHPSYTLDTKPYQLYVMSYPDPMSIEEFNRFRDYSLNHVLTYVEH